MKTKRIAHRVYGVTYNGKTYEIDGQNHEYDSKEWELYEVNTIDNIWIETYPTKREALQDIPTLLQEK